MALPAVSTKNLSTELFCNWSKYLAPYLNASPIIANVDDDPELEIIFAQNSYTDFGITIFNHDGSELGVFPSYGSISATPVACDIDNDGNITISCVSSEAGELAKKKIEDIVAEVEVGKVYEGPVIKLLDFGAIVNIMPGKDGLVHISKLADRRVAKVEDVVNIGDEVIVKVVEIDDMGRINLTLAGVTEEDKKRAI